MKHAIFILITAGCLICIVPQASSAILINEIMYNPTVGDFTNEWIELINTGNSTISISANARIYDSTDPSNWGTGHPVDQAFTIDPGERFVLARDPVAFNAQYGPYYHAVVDCNMALSNVNPMYIKFEDGVTVHDMVFYDPDWGGDGNGMTLERLSTSWEGAGYGNWRESKWDGGTPGHMNSVNPEPTTLLVLGILGSLLGGLGITIRRKNRKDS